MIEIMEPPPPLPPQLFTDSVDAPPVPAVVAPVTMSQQAAPADLTIAAPASTAAVAAPVQQAASAGGSNTLTLKWGADGGMVSLDWGGQKLGAPPAQRVAAAASTAVAPMTYDGGKVDLSKPPPAIRKPKAVKPTKASSPGMKPPPALDLSGFKPSKVGTEAAAEEQAAAKAASPAAAVAASPAAATAASPASEAAAEEQAAAPASAPKEAAPAAGAPAAR